MATKLAILGLAITGASSRSVNQKRLDNGVGRTPALGWNSWASPPATRNQSN